MTRRTTTIRWPPEVHKEIVVHAQTKSLSFNDYVVEATIARWAYEMGIAENADAPRVAPRLETGLRRIRQLLEEHGS